jgi:hypothetical protein
MVPLKPSDDKRNDLPIPDIQQAFGTNNTSQKVGRPLEGCSWLTQAIT